MSILQAPPLSLYIHLPWCVRKCPYCDFNSHPIDGAVPQERYLAALLKDLDAQAQRVAGRTVHSIFMGGGTPSLFSPEVIGRLLKGIRARISCSADVEVTMEANPGTIERGRFAGYRDAGVNRVSLGGQSFNPRHLQALGRIHSREDTLAAAEELHAAGLTNFNIDLMYALPGQTIEEAQTDVRMALQLRPAHLSHYQLTLEPGTPFFHKPPPLPPEEDCWQMQLRCQELLAHHGYAQYEVSAYAAPDNRCKHNLNYWQFGDYLGVGAGAHGKITAAGERKILRTVHPKHPRRYLEEIEAGRDSLETRAVAAAELPFEFMLNALRLREGFEREQFESRCGLAIESIAAPIDGAMQKGLLERRGENDWRPTPLGFRFLNDLQLLFLPSARDCRAALTPSIPC